MAQIQEQKQKKKVLYVITKSNFGGAQRYVYDLATRLPKREFDILVVFGGEGVLKEKLDEADIPTISLPRLARDIRFFDEVRVFFSLCALFVREKPAIIHLNSSKIGGLGALAGRLYNVLVRIQNLYLKPYPLSPARIIFTAHGWPFGEDRPYWQIVIIRFLSWLSVVLSHTVITVSRYNEREGREMPFAKDKIVTIHNGIAVPRFLSRADARAELLGERAAAIAHNTVWIGIIAELTKNKGLSYAIEGIYRLRLDEDLVRPVVFVVIGGGEERYRLAHLIADLDLEDSVFLTGSKKNAATYLKAFDLFLLTSIKEGFPYALLEAGEAGLPVITTAVGGTPEIVEDMKTGMLIRPREVGEIKKALHYALSHEEKMHAFGASLKKQMRAKFSLDRMAEETFALYRS